MPYIVHRTTAIILYTLNPMIHKTHHHGSRAGQTTRTRQAASALFARLPVVLMFPACQHAGAGHGGFGPNLAHHQSFIASADEQTHRSNKRAMERLHVYVIFCFLLLAHDTHDQPIDVAGMCPYRCEAKHMTCITGRDPLFIRSFVLPASVVPPCLFVTIQFI
jgi:hypothetical protein